MDKNPTRAKTLISRIAEAVGGRFGGPVLVLLFLLPDVRSVAALAGDGFRPVPMAGRLMWIGFMAALLCAAYGLSAASVAALRKVAVRKGR